MIGDQNTGKTSIIHRYVRGEFRERYEVTIGAGINLKKIAWNNNEVLTIEFFDIGGRINRSLHMGKTVGTYSCMQQVKREVGS